MTVLQQKQNKIIAGRLEDQSTAIDHNICAINVTAADITAQQHNRSCQFFGRPHPTHRVALCPHLSPWRQPLALVEDRVHVSRRDGINPDAVPGPFRGQTAPHVQERGLGDVVCRLRLGVIDPVAADGRDEYDLSSLAAFNHLPGAVRMEPTKEWKGKKKKR